MQREFKTAEGALERAARKAKWLAYVADARAPRPTPIEYVKPKHTALGKRCASCGRLRSDFGCANGQCTECYRLDALEKYVRRMRKRQVRMRILNGMGTNAD